jgi:glycosyltransferase involved in cell wall biosynthesis
VRIAIAHDYLTQRGGAERVVLAMSRAFPDAPIYTLLYDPLNTYPEFADRDIRVSRLNTVAPLRRHHRLALPVLPAAASSVFVDADIVLTSSSGWAHGFRTSGRKLVYCYTPARWLYLRDEYLGEGCSLPKRLALKVSSPYLRAWDRYAVRTCERYLTLSNVVQQRIADVYGITADVLPPPTSMTAQDPVEVVPEVHRWSSKGTDRQGFYLCVARLLPYKNVDAVIRAFALNGRPLIIVGRGPESARLSRMATPNVLMLSDLTDAQLNGLYRDCRALVAASYEDYGLTTVEAGVWGRPTIALRRGGYLDTVEDGISGIFFDFATPEVIADAVARFEISLFEPDKIQKHVAQFNEKRYAERLSATVTEFSETV